MTDEWRKKISASGKGKRRSIEQRVRYSASKRGKNNPNYKDGSHADYATRIFSSDYISPEKGYRAQLFEKDPNHKAISVEWLDGEHDTYCMEVPGYDWFYANNVLVHNCTFCYRMTPGFRPRSVNAVMEEMSYLHDRYGITAYQFADELLMSSRSRAIEFSEAIMRLPFKLKWDCNGRLNYATPEVLSIMKRSGCNYINYGVEALDDEVLRKMRKKLSVETIYKGVEATIEAGITPGLNLMWGNPGDTVETLEKATGFLIAYDGIAELRTIRPVTPFPGCELFNLAVEQGKLQDVADFYENKHVNTDLFTVSFIREPNHEQDMPVDVANRFLAQANRMLVKAYYKRCADAVVDKAMRFYRGEDKSFRGFRSV